MEKKRRFVVILFATLILFGFFSFKVSADTIYLKNKNIIKGEIIEETEEVVTIKIDMPSGSAELNFNKNEIEKIEKLSKEEKKKGDVLVYKIVEKSDLSMKALTKKLSSYNSMELSQLPINKRLRYKILIEPGFLKEEYDKLINKIINDITAKDSDIDEISLWIYDDQDVLDSGYNVARVLWHPAGGWGFTVTPEIATSNDRTGYKTNIEWTDKYKLKFEHEQKMEKVATRKKKTVGSKCMYYKYSITYPEEVGLNEVNEMKLTIANLATMSDTELAIHNTRYIKENGKFVSYTKKEKSPFKIIRIEPDPQRTDNFFGIMGIYYRGLKAKESKNITLYFKLIREGIYRCMFTFYTDKYADDKNESFPEINIKCTQ